MKKSNILFAIVATTLVFLASGCNHNQTRTLSQLMAQSALRDSVSGSVDNYYRGQRQSQRNQLHYYRGEMENGGYYEGEMLNYLPHGYGEYSYSTGDNYAGKFRNGTKNGHGTYTWRDGAKYVGNFENGEINGKGTLIRPNGTILDGFWVNGKLIK